MNVSVDRSARLILVCNVYRGLVPAVAMNFDNAHQAKFIELGN